MSQPRAIGAWLIASVMVVSACSGHVVLSESSTAKDTATAHSPRAEFSSPDSSPGDRELPDEDGADATGWWPPAPERPAPTTPKPSAVSTPGSGDTPPARLPGGPGTGSDQREESRPEERPSPDPGEDSEQTSPPQIPNWQERIYASRHGERPAKFATRAEYSSCGDFERPAGVELIGSSLAECLDAGQQGGGAETAIVVQTETGAVEVWFVRVGPGESEYFIDASDIDGSWKYAQCDATASIEYFKCDERAAIVDDHGDEAAESGDDTRDPRDGASEPTPPKNLSPGSAEEPGEAESASPAE